MTMMKNKCFKNPDELCEFVNENSHIQIVAVNTCPLTYQNEMGVNCEITNFILFYKEKDIG